MPRIVSLIASATEIVCALGMEKDLVGRSHECDFPDAVRELPVCTAPKFDIEGTSREIDERVKNALKDATSVYRIHENVLRQLQPDVLITQSQCDVCAVSAKDVEAALCSWLDSRPAVVTLEPNCLADVWTDIARVAAALGVPERGKKLVKSLRERMQSIATKAQSEASKPTVACLEWIDPLMAAGNWMPELVELAGGVNLFGHAGKHSPWMTWEELQARDPDVIVAMPCGYDMKRTRQDMDIFKTHPNGSTLGAVQKGRVFVTDGNQYFNRPGPRLVESLEILAEIFHPAAFAPRHQGGGWELASV